MIQTPQEMKALSNELSTAMWTFATVGVLLESGLAAELCEPKTLEELSSSSALPRSRIECCLDVAAAYGIVKVDPASKRYQLAEGVKSFSQPPAYGSLQGSIRSQLMQALVFLDSARSSDFGWKHTDRALLQAQGDASSVFPPMFKNMLPQLGDLAERLERQGARMLDVGVGVASLAIGMCQVFPQISVVGLDIFDVPLGIARENVARANLESRIELRKLAVDELTDEGAYDVAWLPSFFIPSAVLERATARVFASLRSGGWMLFPAGSSSPAERDRAITALVTNLWGGPSLAVADATALLEKVGFTSVRAMPGPPSAPALMVARRG
jgi:hypothetical protein